MAQQWSRRPNLRALVFCAATTRGRHSDEDMHGIEGIKGTVIGSIGRSARYQEIKVDTQHKQIHSCKIKRVHENVFELR